MERRKSTVSLVSETMFATDPIITSFNVFSGPEHYRPDENTFYFSPLPPSEKAVPPRICTVVFPFFNESKTELQRSLLGMYNQAIDCQSLNIELHVVAIMDGWWKASDTMKEYIKEMFPSNRGTSKLTSINDSDSNNEVADWWDHIDNIPEKSDLVETYVLQRLSVDGFIEDVDVGNDSLIKLSLIIKRDNRRKHNSHEWFFQCFAAYYKCEYAFATDCGTLYAKKCVYYLIKYMDNNPKVSASTGRQRVMSSAMQSCQDEGILAMWYRAGQAYDYEASISSFQGAFSLIGMLPVLPGPCGMYRYADVAGECLDYYFSTVNISPEDTTMVTGNLLLAEDRILSYAAALVTGKFTTWVPHAIFYFEAETDSNKFISQRRRWTNGSFAGYIYLLITNPGLLFNSKHTWYFKIISFILLLLQLLMFLLVSISPAIFMSMSFAAVGSIATFKDPSTTRAVQYTVLSLYIFLYLTFVFVHNKNKFVGWLYFPALIFNAGLLLLILSAIIVAVLYGEWLVLLIVGLIMGSPFLLSFLHSFESFVMMVTTFIPFMFFLPTFIAWFAAYSFSRTWDLSWGNRPSDTMDSVSKADKDAKQAKMKSVGLIITVVLAVLNVAIGVSLTLIHSANLFVYISLAISFPSLIQMFLSFFFYLFYTPHYSMGIAYKGLGHSVERLVGIFSTIICWILVIVSLSMAEWVSRTGHVTRYPPDRPYVGHYGPLSSCVIMPTIFSGISDLDTIVYAGEYCEVYGSSLFVNWPTIMWAISLVIIIIVLLFVGITSIAVTTSSFMKDKSRVDSLSVMYMAASTILIAIVIFLFPAGFGNASLHRWNRFFWLLEDEQNLCGDSSGFYKLGDCHIGAGYIVFIFSFPFALISTICYISMNRKKAAAKRIEAQRKRQKRILRRPSVQEKVLQSRLDRIETMLMNGTIIVEVDEDASDNEDTKFNLNSPQQSRSKSSLKKLTELNSRSIRSHDDDEGDDDDDISSRSGVPVGYSV